MTKLTQFREGAHAGAPPQSASLDAVPGRVGYITRPATKPYRYTAAFTGGAPQLFAEDDPRPVPVINARPVADRLSLDRQGIELWAHGTRVSDFYNDGEVEAVYYPEVEQLLKSVTGARRVVVFDHTRRSDGGAAKDSDREAVRYVHNDYTDTSGRERVRTLLGREGLDHLKTGRIAQVNVWRPIRGPVVRAPLGVIDAASVASEDLIATDQIYPDRVGEIFHVAWSVGHRWLYVPRMTRDEVLLIKGWDSATDGRARFTPHAAFDDPETPADAPARESIEVRTLLVF